ncbi:hypothetical protein H1R20_g3981, partial [Candolleomyces eurysporus]
MRIHGLISLQSLSAKKGYGRHPRLWLDVQQHENLCRAYFKDVWKSKRAIKVAADAALSVVPSLASTQKAVDLSQGDAKFAKEVLEKMGCKVRETETTGQVKARGGYGDCDGCVLDCDHDCCCCEWIIASWHDWSGGMTQWNAPGVKEKYDIASQVGGIVKIVGKPETLQDTSLSTTLRALVGKLPNVKPFISINMGGACQMSRILNTTLTPVSHPLLPNKAAPGQLSFKETQKALHLLGLLPAKKFYLFGTPIGHSMSPTLHNTAFKLLGLPHNYELLETKDVGEEIKVAISEPDFGGASVTIPFKLDVIPLLDRLMDEAEKIGAVNTIIPKTVTNADGGSGKVLQGSVGLVIEAGGTARVAIYALNSLGVGTVYVYNRTKRKAEELVEQALGGDKTLKVVDVPASATTTASSPSPSPSNDSTAVAAGVALPKSLFDYRDGPAVVVDMAYKPEETRLLRLAKESGSSNWVGVPGVEVLLEQGHVQFELWTGRKCPKEQVGTTVLTRYRAQA